MPFPYVENQRIGHRPALVLRAFEPLKGLRLVWVLMITSAENELWLGDVPVGDRHRDFGLPVPCVIRTAKVATIEVGQAEWRGRLSHELLAAVLERIG